VATLFRRARRVPEVTANRTSFHVAFGEKWQRDFDSLPEAKKWAKEVSGSGPMTWVVERWEGNRPEGVPPGCRLRATFPEERREEAVRLWVRSKAFPPPPSSAGG
jgi:hypothetical protein